MLVVIFGLFGLVIGSFLNVVILRKGVRSLGGRSSCMQCRAPIHWYDLIPVFSWIALRGRCRHCGSRISWQYPLVEAMTSILFALIGGGASTVPIYDIFSIFFIADCLAIVCMLIMIAVYDLRHTIIPDDWVWTFNVLALLLALSVFPFVGLSSALLSSLFWGLCAPAPLFLLWLVSSGRWMGLGDVKLALGIGWLLGAQGLVAVFGAFVIGALTLVPVMLVARAVTHSSAYANRLAGLTMKSEVPFGPFLIIATLVVWFLGLYDISLPWFIL